VKKLLLVTRIVGIVWVTVSSAYLLMDTFNIQGPQWFILFPLYSILDIGIGHLCFLFSLLTMIWLLFAHFFKNKSTADAVQFSFETLLINLLGVLLTFVHSWWNTGTLIEKGGHPTVLFICIIGGIVGAWPVLFIESFSLNFSRIFRLLAFTVNSTLSVLAGTILLFYSIVRIQKITSYQAPKEAIVLATIAFLLNVVTMKGWSSRKPILNDSADTD
jgi:hypothetical protein